MLDGNGRHVIGNPPPAVKKKFHNWKEASKIGMGSNLPEGQYVGAPEITAGALMRIADALESLARSAHAMTPKGQAEAQAEEDRKAQLAAWSEWGDMVRQIAGRLLKRLQRTAPWPARIGDGIKKAARRWLSVHSSERDDSPPTDEDRQRLITLADSATFADLKPYATPAALAWLNETFPEKTDG